MREKRRVDAREQLRAAYEMLAAMGAEVAERARRELLATGETVETAKELTPGAAQIVRLAWDGCTNPEISTQLFIRPRPDGACARCSQSSASALARNSGRHCPTSRRLPCRPSLVIRGLSWGDCG